jgi:hypothetical protein
VVTVQASREPEQVCVEGGAAQATCVSSFATGQAPWTGERAYTLVTPCGSSCSEELDAVPWHATARIMGDCSDGKGCPPPAGEFVRIVSARYVPAATGSGEVHVVGSSVWLVPGGEARFRATFLAARPLEVTASDDSRVGASFRIDAVPTGSDGATDAQAFDVTVSRPLDAQASDAGAPDGGAVARRVDWSLSASAGDPCPDAFGCVVRSASIVPLP